MRGHVFAWVLSCVACGPSDYTPAPPLEDPAPASEQAVYASPEEETPPAFEAPALALETAPEGQTFEADVDARPRWAVRGGRLPGHSSNVHQIPDKESFFDSAEPHAGPFRGILVCKAEVLGDRFWDQRGRSARADVTLRLRLPQAAIDIRGPEDEHSFFASAPNVRLAEGDEVKVHAIDRDMMADDEIARLTATYDGFPLAVASDEFRLECRGISQARAEEEARSRLEVFRTRFVTLRPAEEEQGRRNQQVQPVQDAIRHLAAWVGWSHPTVRACVRALLEEVCETTSPSPTGAVCESPTAADSATSTHEEPVGAE